MNQTVIASLARIADFDRDAYQLDRVPQSLWATGDYVVGEVVGEKTSLYHVEECDGNMREVLPGARVIGALGERAATLEGVGSWRAAVDGHMHALTSAGLFGAFTSLSRFLPAPMQIDYVGHIVRRGERVRMADFALRAIDGPFRIPTVLLVGTSMSSGKTIAGKIVCRLLAKSGHKVFGAKLTGAGRYRDILAFGRAGAFAIGDFVDVGLPSTAVSETEFRTAIRPLLHHINQSGADTLVVEAGASPLEPYNGAAAVDELQGQVQCTILSASDPYAVVGVMQAYALEPDIVAGPATNTSAGIDLVRKLTGLRGVDVNDPASVDDLRAVLAAKLDIELREAC